MPSSGLMGTGKTLVHIDSFLNFKQKTNFFDEILPLIDILSPLLYDLNMLVTIILKSMLIIPRSV